MALPKTAQPLNAVVAEDAEARRGKAIGVNQGKGLPLRTSASTAPSALGVWIDPEVEKIEISALSHGA